MPLYDFQCPRCGFTHEYLLSAGASEYYRPLCRMCWADDRVPGGIEMERVPTAANFTVKGYSATNGYSK